MLGGIVTLPLKSQSGLKFENKATEWIFERGNSVAESNSSHKH